MELALGRAVFHPRWKELESLLERVSFRQGSLDMERAINRHLYYFVSLDHFWDLADRHRAGIVKGRVLTKGCGLFRQGDSPGVELPLEKYLGSWPALCEAFLEDSSLLLPWWFSRRELLHKQQVCESISRDPVSAVSPQYVKKKKLGNRGRFLCPSRHRRWLQVESHWNERWHWPEIHK